MTHEEIKNYLPHRDAMLLIGEVEVEERDGARVALGKTPIVGNEWFLQGHFPGHPVVPGVILCEIMAQSCCLICDTAGGLPFFAGIKNAKFRHQVCPGDTLETECTIIRSLGELYMAKGVGYVRNSEGEREVAVEAEFSFVCKKDAE